MSAIVQFHKIGEAVDYIQSRFASGASVIPISTARPKKYARLLWKALQRRGVNMDFSIYTDTTAVYVRRRKPPTRPPKLSQR